MRKIFLFSFCLAIFALQTTSGAVKLKFRYVGGVPDKVEVAAPAVAYGINTHYLNPSQDKVLKLDIEEVTSTMIMVGRNRALFYLQPGKTYDITIDSTPGKEGISVDDPVAAAFLDLTKDWDPYTYDSGSDYNQYPLSTSGATMMKNFEELIERDKAVFDNIRMTDQMRDAILNEVEVYHLTSLAMALRQDWWRNGYNESKMYPDFIETWRKVYEKYPICNKYIKSSYLTDYAKQYCFWFALYLSGNPRSRDFNNRIDPYYRMIDDEPVREETLWRTIYIEAILNNPARETRVLPAINKFIETYPDNEYVGMMREFVESIENWQKDPKARLSPDMKIVEGYDQIETFDQAMARFAGKPVYIDFWFIACPHCIYEFDKSAPIKKFLKQNDMEILYLARESDQMDTAWRNAILEFGLTGNHIRMSDELMEDLGSRGYLPRGYPAYMIVDKDGKVVVKNAKRPSSGAELEKEIIEALGL